MLQAQNNNIDLLQDGYRWNRIQKTRRDECIWLVEEIRQLDHHKNECVHDICIVIMVNNLAENFYW